MSDSSNILLDWKKKERERTSGRDGERDTEEKSTYKYFQVAQECKNRSMPTDGSSPSTVTLPATVQTLSIHKDKWHSRDKIRTLPLFKVVEAVKGEEKQE